MKQRTRVKYEKAMEETEQKKIELQQQLQTLRPILKTLALNAKTLKQQVRFGNKQTKWTNEAIRMATAYDCRFSSISHDISRAIIPLQVEKDISKRYNNRPVNIMGLITSDLK